MEAEILRRFARRLLEPIRRNGILDVETAMRRGRVVECEVGGSKIRWLITNSNDEIQREQLKNGYYELAELQRLRNDLGQCPSIVDISANIGNHAIFFIKEIGCRQLVAI